MEIQLNKFKVLSRNKIIKEIYNENDFLDFINENFYKTDNFVKVVNSLKKYINDNIDYSITKTEFYTILKKFKKSSRFSKMYWLKRGYNRNQSKEKINEIQSKIPKKHQG